MTGPADGTLLAQRLKALIGARGSVSVEYFMDACLNDARDGYYRRGGMLGAKGDFVTAPEISQAFGELIGLWCAVVWQAMGQPRIVNLVELGPGRGTLMADALRAAKSVPGFAEALRVHLVEVSAPLRAEQREALKDWQNVVVSEDWPEPDTSEPAPLIAIGNEFLDALPIEQFVFREGSFCVRGVGLDDEGDFAFVTGAGGFSAPGVDVAPAEGDVFEACGAFYDIADRLDAYVQSGCAVAALFVDYGHTTSGYGDTLQGVRQHRYVSPLATPGENDLTAQVDFAALGRALEGPGLVVEPAVTQAEFLGSLGIMQRASKLMAANPAKAGEIEAGVARLMAPNGMGTRFKVLGARSADLPPLPGFATG